MTTSDADASILFPPPRRIIGLTGGIGMGKTLVSDYLARVHQLPILDADLLARAAVAPGTTALTEVVDRYGPGILHADGTLDRRRLGEIIFSSPAERQWLEQCVHPYVCDQLALALQTPPLEPVEQYPTVVMVIPLLFEARMTGLVTEVWVIHCTAAQQIERLGQRDQLGLEQLRARIDSQMPIERKMALADVVLDNSQTPELVFGQVDRALAHPPVCLTALPS
jgi:dephospho-CoA kinase